MIEIISMLDYDEESGVLTWNQNVGFKVKKGDVAGTISNRGYVAIHRKGVSYSAHRLIAMKCGLDIEGKDIDHINGVRYDNRLSNIRVVDRKVNLKNKRIQKNSSTGVTGVSFKSKPQKYAAAIKVNSVDIFLGQFFDKWDAICARMSANNKYGFHRNHGRLNKK